ncbi:MAG: hypothetical protein ACTHU0_25795 [Kofleriaceae bacterium]
MDEENNIRKLLRAWATGLQDVQNALVQLLTLRGIDVAVGAQLDVLGKKVGQPRNGLSDDVYRRYIRARIIANRSRGSIGDVLRVADLVIYDDVAYLHLKQYGHASFELIVERFVLDDRALLIALLSFLRATAAVGVRPIARTWPLPEDELMVFDGTNGTGVGAVGLGFGNALDPTEGGAIANVMD